MKITATKARKIKEWYDTIGGEEECSAIFHHVTYKRHKLTFRVEMSDSRTYETTHTVNGCDDYHESGWLGNPINEVEQFTRDIQAATFPDMVFFDEYDEEYENAEKPTTKTASQSASCTQATAPKQNRPQSTPSSATSLTSTPRGTSRTKIAESSRTSRR